MPSYWDGCSRKLMLGVGVGVTLQRVKLYPLKYMELNIH
jgi:hypothetical protein